MEWIRISKNKLKIMLSAEDARHYELDCDATDLGELRTRSAFHEILSDVKNQTDFDASEDKIYIQMYPSKGGGCELFVTKMGLLLSDEEEIPVKEARENGRFRLPPRAAQELRAFRFDTLPSLLAACRRSAGLIETRESRAFRDEHARWWLLLRSGAGRRLSFLREYGYEVRADVAKLYLAEHGTQICEQDAVQTLARL
ncbi:MAG: adaptor protein MecA [Clostridia bacterium]|nr:adaptor protein MecA [Clostridia bacterium]